MAVAMGENSMAKIRQIAVVLALSNAYQRQILMGIGRYAAEVGNWSLYVESDPTALLPDLKNWRGDGIIADFLNRNIELACSNLSLSVVGIETHALSCSQESNIPCFATDNRAIGRLGVDHLVEQGFTRLAFCGHPVRKMYWSTEREQAFVERAGELGVPCSVWTGPVVKTRRWSDLQQQLSVWLESLAKPVGVMAAHDTRARHVIEACRTSGIRIPEDVAVLGVDNDELQCELTTPPLSSVEHGARNMGYRAAALLDRLIAGKRPDEIQHLVEPNGVVTRRSTDILVVNDVDVATALAFIRQHACDPIGMSDVLDAVQVSRSVLLPRFKAVVGRTIHAEIQRVQIERVRTLITTTGMPLKQIAIMAGFINVNYMTTIFRKQTGVTPGECRKRSQL
jgi:LacI family transcriptional regulator